MDRIYKYNPNVFYKLNEGRYLQLMSAKDLYIQNITVSEQEIVKWGFWHKLPLLPLLWHANAVDEN